MHGDVVEAQAPVRVVVDSVMDVAYPACAVAASPAGSDRGQRGDDIDRHSAQIAKRVCTTPSDSGSVDCPIEVASPRRSAGWSPRWRHPRSTRRDPAQLPRAPDECDPAELADLIDDTLDWSCAAERFPVHASWSSWGCDEHPIRPHAVSRHRGGGRPGKRHIRLRWTAACPRTRSQRNTPWPWRIDTDLARRSRSLSPGITAMTCSPATLSCRRCTSRRPARSGGTGA